MPLGHVAFRNGDPVAGRPLRRRIRPIHLVDEAAAVPGTKGIMLTFDDFVQEIEDFGTKIQPLMKSRAK